MAEGQKPHTKRGWIVGAGVVLVAAAGVASALALRSPEASPRHAQGYEQKLRAHFDHAAVITEKFETPQAVTRRCLECHPDSTHVMRTSHWRWLGDEVEIPGRSGKTRIGKKNVLNNFCISTVGNEKGCTKCHVGYGWADASFDFDKVDNIDCLACHERSGTVGAVVAAWRRGTLRLVPALAWDAAASPTDPPLECLEAPRTSSR